MPRLNKHLDERWVKHCQQLHRTRLKQMKPAIDNKPPPTYVHLAEKLKKRQLDEERYSQIERDNFLLLDKISYIIAHPQVLDEKYMGPPVTFGKSLNKDFCKRELLRITKENRQILRRIQNTEPYYNHLEWEKDSRRAEVYLRICAEYPIAPPSTRASAARQSGARASTAHQSGGSTREPRLIKSTPAPLQASEGGTDVPARRRRRPKAGPPATLTTGVPLS